MGLSSALATAMSGLRANQAALSIISSNISNAQTPGYVTQNVNQIEVPSGTYGTTVEVTGVNRQLDLFIQNQLRTETSGGSYATQISNILSQLQSVYGTPGSDGTLENAYNNFTTALQSLSSSPSDTSAQSVALQAAQSLAGQLNTTTQGVQTLRSNVDQDIGTSAAKANTDMTQIAQINTKLQGLSSTDPEAATLMDQRDSAIDDLSKLVDIRTVTDQSNQVNVFTNSGIQLVGQGLASTVEYTSQGALSATSLYNPNPAKSGVGALSIKLPNGAQIDAANGVISSGQIAADLKLRDQTLVQAQTQLDQMAATLASSLSDQTTAGTPITVPGTGFSVSTANMQPGNSVNLTYTNSTTGIKQQISIVNVTDPNALPLQNAAGANPLQIGVNFSLPQAQIVSSLNSALAANGVQVSMSGAATLNLFSSIPSTTINSSSVTTTPTATSLATGSVQMPLFTDGNSLYTGQITASGLQMTGLGGRISVNPAVLANPSSLSIYNTSPQTAAGDNTRSDFMYTQLTSATFSYSPATGLGSTSQPFQGTLSNYLQSFISQQGSASTLATQLQQGQSVVVSTLQQKFNSTSAVNIDTEMSNLIQVQNTYAANAHLMSVVQSMMQSLLQVQL